MLWSRPLGVEFAGGLEADGLRCERVRGVADQDPAGRCCALQPRRGVDDVAHRRVLGAGQRADQHLAGVDADAHADAGAAGKAGRADEVGERRLHPQRRPHRAFGVVLVSDRRAEQGEDAVAEDLVDPAAEGGDVVDEQLEARVDQPLDGFGIAVLGQGREPDQIGEQHRGDPPFLGLRGRDGIPARRAEPGICRNLGRTRRTQHEPVSVGQIGPADGGWIRQLHVRPRPDGRHLIRGCTPRSVLIQLDLMTETLTPSTAAGAVDAMKIYGEGDSEVRALDGVTVAFEAGRFTAIMGPSGSGKSTLMHCLAGLDSLTQGAVYIGDTYLAALNDKELTMLRRTASASSSRPTTWCRRSTPTRTSRCRCCSAAPTGDQEWIDNVIDTVGLRDRLKHRPSELSGGQQQRVAVARALASKPTIIFADEPTGNLDSRAGAEILEFMRRAVRDLGQTIVMVTHDPNAASYADRVIFLADGKVVDEMTEPTADRVLDRMKRFGD